MTPVAEPLRREGNDASRLESPSPSPKPNERSVLSIVRKPADRRSRAERRERTEVPWVSTVKLGWGLEVRLLNISSSGLLLETGTKLTPGSITELKLIGPDLDITIPVRFVRSEVADTNPLGVTFHTAATFEKPLPIVDPMLMMPAHPQSDIRWRPGVPKSPLGRLMAQVAAELGEEKHPNLTVALAEGVRRVLKADRVRISSTPIDVVDGQESIAVAIPTSDGSPATLQATFQPGWEPTGLDLKLLTAAAGLAAVVIEFGSDSL